MCMSENIFSDIHIAVIFFPGYKLNDLPMFILFQMNTLFQIPKNPAL
jgi:hypothetical protein